MSADSLELKNAYRHGIHDAIQTVITTIQVKQVKTTDDLIPALLACLREYSENKTIQ